MTEGVPKNGCGSPAGIRLDSFGQQIFEAFGHEAYLVGTAAAGKQWRDVDVRLILPDSEFRDLFPGYAATHGNDTRWQVFCDAFSGMAERMTGLPVDFQIQSQAIANRYSGHLRIPLIRFTHHPD